MRISLKWSTVRITRLGEPVADIVPHGPPERPAGWFGSMSDRIRITDDITATSSDLVPGGVEEE